MNAEFFEFPKQKDWKQIHNVSAFKKIYSVLDSLKFGEDPTDDFTRVLELKRWLYEMRKRVEDTAISYFFLMFYYEKGIPDRQWYKSPGTNGASVQYFPDFEEVHYSIKKWFDYFSDTLYYKLFSALDLVGHLLNVRYDLNIPKERVYFSTALKKLKDKDKNLYKCLNDIKNSQAFEKARSIRRDITHNYLPHSAGLDVKRCGQSITIDLKEYIPSEEIVANIREALKLFAKILQCISK